MTLNGSDGRILVTGANGFVGRAVVERLKRDGRWVACGVRHSDGERDDLILGDLTAQSDFAGLFRGVDAIVHCAARAHVLREREADPLAAFRAVNRDATVALARAAAASGVRRFVFLSSIGVNGGETKDRPFSAKDAPKPNSDYARAKWEAEQALAEIAGETGLQIVTIRPPLVIGPDPKGNLGKLTRAITKGVPLPLGLITHNRRDLVSLETLADLVATVIDHPAAPGEVLLVSDGRPVSTREIVGRLGAAIGRQPRFIPVPPALLKLALSALGKASLASQLLGNLELDIDETHRRLGWQPARRMS